MKPAARLVALAGTILAISLAGVSMVSASAAPARVAAPSAPFNATFTAPGGALMGCCYFFIRLDPTEVTIPRIGRATVSGEISECGSLCGPEERGTTLFLMFTTPSGDTLTLGGFKHASVSAPLTWSVIGGTGRFAHASGSGTYTFDAAFLPAGLETTVTLSGTFRLRQ
jgi:hypothetical protein